MKRLKSRKEQEGEQTTRWEGKRNVGTVGPEGHSRQMSPVKAANKGD